MCNFMQSDDLLGGWGEFDITHVPKHQDGLSCPSLFYTKAQFARLYQIPFRKEVKKKKERNSLFLSLIRKRTRDLEHQRTS